MRAHLRETIVDRLGNAAAAATVYVYEPGTTTLLVQTMRDAATGGNTLANPLSADANGEIGFFLDSPQYVNLLVQFAGTERTIPYAVVGAPADPIVVQAVDSAPVNNSTVLVSLPLLTFHLEANETWSFEALIVFTANAGATGIKLGMAVPAATLAAFDLAKNVGSSALLAASESIPLNLPTAAGTVYAYVAGLVYAGNAGGDVTLRFAQQVAHASDAVVKKGSWLSARRLV
jgi:hypothetical protein